MKPRKLNEQIDERINQVARLKADTPSFDELSRETGLSKSYLRQVVSARVQRLTNKARISTEAECA